MSAIYSLADNSETRIGRAEPSIADGTTSQSLVVVPLLGDKIGKSRESAYDSEASRDELNAPNPI